MSDRWRVALAILIISLCSASPSYGKPRVESRALRLQPSSVLMRVDASLKMVRAHSYQVVLTLYREARKGWDKLDQARASRQVTHVSKLEGFELKAAPGLDRGEVTFTFRIAENESPRTDHVFFNVNRFQ